MRKLADLLGLLRSLLLTIPLVYALTILMGMASLLVSPFDREATAQHAVARLWARLILWVCLVRLRVQGRENLDPGRSYVYIANHHSYLDIPVVFVSVPPGFRIMAKASLFPIPFLGWHLRRTGHLPIPRDNPLASARRLIEAVSLIRQGRSLVVFPEGGRSTSEQVGEFKAGVFLAAVRVGVPIVPMTIRGSRRVLPPHSWHIRPGRIDVFIEPPLSTDGLAKEDAEALRAEVHARISRNLQATAD